MFHVKQSHKQEERKMKLPFFYDIDRTSCPVYEDAEAAELESVKERARELMSELEENPDISDEEYAEISACYDSCVSLRDYRDFLGA
jgi:hypothetical protein